MPLHVSSTCAHLKQLKIVLHSLYSLQTHYKIQCIKLVNIKINVYWCLGKVPFILIRFTLSVKFLNRFLDNIQIINFMKTAHLEPSCCMRKKRHAEANSHFRNFANAPDKIEKLHNGYEQPAILLFQCSIGNFT